MGCNNIRGATGNTRTAWCAPHVAKQVAITSTNTISGNAATAWNTLRRNRLENAVPNSLHYRGNVEPDADQLFGPDMFGAMYLVKTVGYDAEMDVTTITF